MAEATGNKRIAKNTLFLYLRMILIMGVSLYTSRIVLHALGITDYGIYNVVGGVVIIFGSLTGSLSGATSRYITFELGKEDKGDVERLFRCCVSVHYIFASAILFIAETVGLWFVMEKLVIPPDRLTAAFWVYQCAVASVIIKIISAPYNALIIAHEKMNAFAMISIVEVCLQLGLVALLLIIPNYRLILYGFSIAFVQICIRIIYSVYCYKNFPEASGKWLWNKQISLSLFKYSGWNLFGFGAVVGYTQGINILLNLFFGPVANAARGFSVQIQSGVNQISTNFQMALRPPTIKSYAKGELQRMHSLMISNAKFSYYLVCFMVMPIIINTPYILHLWLGEIPEYSVAFTRLLLPIALYSTLNGHVIVAVHATGNIKKFQIIEGCMLLCTVPIAYVLLKWGHITAPQVIMVYMIVEFITQFARVWIVYPMVGMKIKRYFSQILLPILLVTIPLTIESYFLARYAEASSFGGLMVSLLTTTLSVIAVVYILGLTKKERTMITQKIFTLFNKVTRKTAI